MNDHSETKKFNFLASIDDLLPVIISLGVLFIALALTRSKVFLTGQTAPNILLAATTTGMMGVGMTFLLSSGNFDLSGGAAICLLGVLTADWVVNKNMPVWLAILLAFVIGILIGAFNGFMIAYVRLNAFITTMATMNIFRGAALMYTKGATVFSIPKAYTQFGDGKLFGKIPMPIVIMVIMFIIGHIVLSKTVFGHKVMAVGGNREAARLAGINIPVMQMAVYIIAGFGYAVTSIVYTGRIGSALTNACDGVEMNAIAGIVIGGCSMAGGKGSMIGTFLGVVMMAMLNTGITLWGVNSYIIKCVQGGALLIAITIDMVRTLIKEKKKY